MSKKPTPKLKNIDVPSSDMTNVSNLSSSEPNKTNDKFLFEKRNYMLMLIGLIVIFVGYLLMIGGNNDNPTGKFPYEEIYSSRRIIIAPIVVLLGFGIECYAILSARSK